MSLCCCRRLFLYTSKNKNLHRCSYKYVPLGVSTYNTIAHNCQQLHRLAHSSASVTHLDDRGAKQRHSIGQKRTHDTEFNHQTHIYRNHFIQCFMRIGYYG